MLFFDCDPARTRKSRKIGDVELSFSIDSETALKFLTILRL